MRNFVLILSGLCFAFHPAIARDSECAFDTGKTHLSRVVAIDSTGGPAYNVPSPKEGVVSSHAPLVLNDREVVLTFDNGPESSYTKYILDILDHHCVKATFFLTGRAALASPESVRDILRRGHTIANHGWLASNGGAPLPIDEVKIDIEKGFTAINRAGRALPAPFYRFPDGESSPDALAYLAAHNVSVWAYDISSGDLEPGATATKIANRTIERVQAAGKGVIVFHDTRKATVDALDDVLHGLKRGGFKVVHIVAGTPYAPDAELAPKVSVDEPAARTRTVSRRFVDSARQQVRERRAERHEQRPE